MTNWWLPSTVEKKCSLYAGNYPARSSEAATAEKIGRCLFFAVTQGGEFWNVIRKATEQVINDYKIPDDAQQLLHNMIRNEDKSVAEYLAPFMLNKATEHASEISNLIRKGLIYDLIVKMSGVDDGTGVSLDPLIVVMSRSAIPASPVDTNSESDDVNITYSTHIKDRESVQRMLQDHEIKRTQRIEEISTPLAPGHPCFPNEEADTVDTPIVLKDDTFCGDPTDVCMIPVSSSSLNHSADQKEPLSLNESEISNDAKKNLFNDSVIMDKSEMNYSNFNFNVTGELEKEFEGKGVIDNDEVITASGDMKTYDIDRADEEIRNIENKVQFDLNNLSSSDSSSLLRDEVEDIEDKDHEFDWSKISLTKVGEFKDSIPLRCATFNPQRAEISVGSNSSKLRLFEYANISSLNTDVVQLEPIITLNNVHEASVYCCDYSSSGELLATGSNDKLVKIFKNEFCPDEGKTISMTVVSERNNHDATIRKVQFMPGQSILASGGGGDGRVYLTDFGIDEVVTFLDPNQPGRSNIITDIAIGNTSTIYTALNSSIYHWDIRTKTNTPLTLGRNIQTVSCSRDEEFNFIATGAEDGCVAFWDTRNSTLPIYEYRKHKRAVRSLSFVGDWLLSGSMDGLLSLHNLSQGSVIVEKTQREKLINVCISSDLRHIATTSSNGYFSFYSIDF